MVQDQRWPQGYKLDSVNQCQLSKAPSNAQHKSNENKRKNKEVQKRQEKQQNKSLLFPRIKFESFAIFLSLYYCIFTTTFKMLLVGYYYINKNMKGLRIIKKSRHLYKSV